MSANHGIPAAERTFNKVYEAFCCIIESTLSASSETALTRPWVSVQRAANGRTLSGGIFTQDGLFPIAAVAFDERHGKASMGDVEGSPATMELDERGASCGVRCVSGSGDIGRCMLAARKGGRGEEVARSRRRSRQGERGCPNLD
jgi:hypothetical protein